MFAGDINRIRWSQHNSMTNKFMQLVMWFRILNKPLLFYNFIPTEILNLTSADKAKDHKQKASTLPSYFQHVNVFVSYSFMRIAFLLFVLIDFYGISGCLPSPFMPKSVPAAPWDVELLVFISIQCFFSVFIRENPSCVCQLRWKARDTTESGSRLNRFHAISCHSSRYLSSISRGEIFPQWGFLEQLAQPNPASLENEAACCFILFLFFFPFFKHSSFPTCNIIPTAKEN